MAEVLRIHAPEVPQCANCGAAHKELGVLCAGCRATAAPAAEAFVQSTIAAAIIELRRYQNQGFPMPGPVSRALVNIQAAYDAAEPRVTIPPVSYVHREQGRCWAYPAGSSVVLGPFGTEELAYTALTEFEADRAKEKP